MCRIWWLGLGHAKVDVWTGPKCPIERRNLDGGGGGKGCLVTWSMEAGDCLLLSSPYFLENLGEGSFSPWTPPNPNPNRDDKHQRHLYMGIIHPPLRASLQRGPFWGIKLTVKTVDEDPASCKRWISRKEIKSAKIYRTKNEKSKDYCKADLKQHVLFFITIFQLAIPAFFRFTDVTELM